MNKTKNRFSISVRELVIFAMLGALMVASKALMDALPNIHLIGVFIVAETIVYRWKALYPLYTFIFITLLLNGFSLWMLPYLYVWTFLWGGAMLVPWDRIPLKIRPLCAMVLCALHGFLYGTLYAPAQALFFGLSFKGMLTWIVTGLPFDAIHGVSNFFCGALIIPLAALMRRIGKMK